MKKHILLSILFFLLFSVAYAQSPVKAKADTLVSKDLDKSKKDTLNLQKKPEDKKLKFKKDSLPLIENGGSLNKGSSTTGGRKIKAITSTLALTPVSDSASVVNTAPVASTKKLSTAKTMSAGTSYSTLSSSGTDAGRTAGSLDVSATGAAAYTIPIAVPPGIGGMVPQVSLVYNSQSGNGLAGYGWNVSGLSSITRIPSTKFHDNYVGSVNFDAHDRFALDGQRLILKSGVYGGDGAEYQTENYSNVRVVSKGVSPYGAAYGPAYFEVFQPDGSKAVYGNSSDSRTHTDFAINYAENAQGIRISYAYTLSNNALSVSQIRYGSKGTATAINQINFVYISRVRTEQAYLNNAESVIRANLLSEIQVVANNVNYRNYVLTHGLISGLSYQRVTQVQEMNGDKSKKFEPIVFSYTSTGGIIKHTVIPGIVPSQIARNNTNVLTGDFTGDGSMDLILYNSLKTQVWTFWGPTEKEPWSQTGDPVTVGFFDEILPMSYLTSDNHLASKQGFALVGNGSDQATHFRVYSSNTNASLGLEYSKQWNAPLMPGYMSECNGPQPEQAISRKYLSGDFNGDGLTDVMAFDYPYQRILHERRHIDWQNYDENSNEPPPFYCVNEYENTVRHKIHFINLDRRLTSDFVNEAGESLIYLSTFDKLYTADFNGDGRTDIVHISHGNMAVYQLNANNQIVKLWDHPDARIDNKYPSFLGDYNGDGKTDVMFATIEKTSGPGPADNALFAVFMSTGKGFIKHEQLYSFRHVKNRWDDENGIMNEYNLMPTDINNDGKTDMVYSYTVTSNGSTQGNITVIAYTNTGSLNNGAPTFDGGQTFGVQNVNLRHDPHSLFLSSDKPNYKLQYGILSDQTIHLFDFSKDVKKESELTSVSQDGLVHHIDYKDVVDDSPGDDMAVYKGTADKYPFPYINIVQAPGLRAVVKLKRQFNNTESQQLFAYRNAVSHAEGLGFLGFGKVIKSNLHLNQFDPRKLYTTTITDPLLRGATIKSLTSKFPIFSESMLNIPSPPTNITMSAPVQHSQTVTATQSITLLPGFSFNSVNGETFLAKVVGQTAPVEDGASVGDYITRTDYTYTSELAANKVYNTKPISVKTKDLLSGTHTTQLFTYDSFNNVTKEVTSFSDAGSKTVDVTYDNNPAGGYVGRPLTKKTTLTNGADTYNTEEEYAYTGYLPTQIKKKGHNTPFLTENLQYDTYGNVTQKAIVTASGLQRSSQSQYDASGRFVTRVTDGEGLETTSEYNTSTGNPISTTDAYNRTTSYSYDAWGRHSQTTNYLGQSNYTAYQRSGSDLVITESSDDGSVKVTTSNALGQTIETKAKDVLGQMVGVASEYDIYGRQTKQSAPSLSGSYNQWNTTEYDDYGRLKQTTDITGKQTTVTYAGLVSTVNDGTKTVTTTKNALGNVIKVEDPGGSINYTHYANGNLKSADFGGSIQAIEQDGWGRKTKLTDPSAGVYTYAYNEFGETLTETTPKGSTTYTYDTNGKVLTKKIQADTEVMNYQYAYDGTTKLLSSLTLSNTDGNNAAYTYSYDSYKRLNSVIEDNEYARFAKTLYYDSFGRVSIEASEAKNERNNKTVSKSILNAYQYGGLKSITDNSTGEKIWEVTALNARGQVTTALLGSTMTQTNMYDAFGFPQYLTTNRTGNTPAQLMQLSYTFDTQRGNLSSRGNTVFNWNESFTYDNLDRLKDFNDNNGNNSQLYDERGRITTNSQIGTYVFSNTSYQQLGFKNLTAPAKTYYQDRPVQTISYNAFKSPIEIIEQGKEKISFQYNAAQGRAHRYYGDEAIDKMTRPYRRHYSEDGSMEITEDLLANTTSFVFYMGGDAYDAPSLWKEDHTATGTTQNLYYLHRDYQGSILLITDKLGAVIEKRTFDAWGNVTNLSDGNGNVLSSFVITDRGYTGHEHLAGVRLIHMNGRLYDPKLHRFLQPDNYVQDPTNTQNFNRYGYVLNNPLKYTDPSGEIFWTPIIALAVWSGAGNWIKNGAEFNAKGLGHFAVGAGTSLITTGIGSGMSSILGGSGFMSGAVVGSISGFGGGFTMGFGNAIVGGVSLGSAFNSGINGGIAGGITGGIIGGVMGGIDAASDGRDFWTGEGWSNPHYRFSNEGDIGTGRYRTSEEIRLDYDQNIGSIDGMSLRDVENKLNTTVSLEGSNLSDDGRIIVGNRKAWAYTQSYHSSGSRTIFSSIRIAPAVGGQPLLLRNLTFKHEFIHAWHYQMGFSEGILTKYSERVTSSYELAYLKAYNLSVPGFLRGDIGRYPLSLNWRPLNKIVPLWLK